MSSMVLCVWEPRMGCSLRWMRPRQSKNVTIGHLEMARVTARAADCQREILGFQESPRP